MADVELQPKNPAPAAEPTGDMIPDELIQQPVMQALMAGSPPAVSGDIKAMEQIPLGDLMVKYQQQLAQAGFGFYQSQQEGLGVIFNSMYIQPQQIVEADQKGALQQIAPPISEVEKAIMGNPAQNPVLSTTGPPAVPPGAPPSPGGPMPTGGGGAPSTSLETARRRNTQLGSPTSGPSPGAGRILNEILRPVV